MLPSTVPSQVALPTGYPAGPGSNPSYPAANAMELNANTPQFHQTPHVRILLLDSLYVSYAVVLVEWHGLDVR